MKTSKATINMLLITVFAFLSVNAIGQDVIYVKAAKSQTKNNSELNTYLIEREIPGAGELSPEQLKGISQKSCDVLNQLGR